MGQLSQKWAVINKMWTVVCKLCTACCCAWQPQTDPSGRPFWHFRNNSLGTHFKWMHDSNTEGNASIVRSYVTSAWMHQLPWIEDCCTNILPPPPTPKSASQGWAYSSGHWARGRVAPRAGHGSIIGHTLLGVWEEVGVSRGKPNQQRKSLLTPNGCDAQRGCHSNQSPRPLNEGGNFIITGKLTKYNICSLSGHGSRQLRYISNCWVLFWKLELGEYLPQWQYLIVGLTMIFASILSKLVLAQFKQQFQSLTFSAALFFFLFFSPWSTEVTLKGDLKCVWNPFAWILHIAFSVEVTQDSDLLVF